MEHRRWLDLVAAVAAVAVVGLHLWMRELFPHEVVLSPGWRTPILALEFATHEADLAFLTGPAAQGVRDAMDAGHRVDMWFPLAYGGLIAVLGLQHALAGRSWGWLAGLAALATVPLDIWENLVLMQITEVLGAGEPAGALLATLRIATWAKWGALGIALAGLAVAGWRREPWTSGICALAAGSVPVAAVGVTPWLCEAMGLGIGACYLVLGLRALWRVRPGRRGAPG